MIKVKNLHKSFGSLQVLKGIDEHIKKGEKVDYAIMKDGAPVILIECKSITENLAQHDSQLFRYFGTTTAKFAILTNLTRCGWWCRIEPKRWNLSPL